MKRHIAGFAILHTIGATLLAVSWYVGLLVPFFQSDRTGLLVLITAVASLGVVCAAFRRWDDVALIRMHLPSLGLAGTVVGISMAIAGLEEGFDIKLLGLATAFSTTLAGLIGHLWLVVTERFLGGRK